MNSKVRDSHNRVWLDSIVKLIEIRSFENAYLNHSFLKVGLVEIALLIGFAIQQFNFPDKRYQIDLIVNPKELNIFISFGSVELFKTKSVQKLWPKIHQLNLLLWQIIQNFLLRNFCGQFLTYEINFGFVLCQNRSKVKFVVCPIGKEKEI